MVAAINNNPVVQSGIGSLVPAANTGMTVEQQNNLLRQQYFNTQAQDLAAQRAAVRADMASKGEEFRITNPGVAVLSGPQFPKMQAIPQAELDAARSKLTPEEQNFYNWKLEQIDPMLHRRIGDIYAEQGVNIYSDPTAAREAMARRPQGEWTDPQWQQKLEAERARLKAEQERSRQNPGPFVIGGGSSANATGALPQSKIQQDYQSFFNTAKPGSYTEFAGGVLYKTPEYGSAKDSEGRPVKQNKAIFYTPDGREYTLTDKTDLNAIAYTIPEIANEWKNQYGFTPTGQAPASGVMTSDNWNPIRQAYADADRNVYATDKDVIFDPQLRAVDLTGYKNNPHGAFEKLAMDVYGGKGMTMQDISRLEDAVGAVGAYVPDPENPGTYKLASPAAAGATGQPAGISAQTQQGYSSRDITKKMNADAQAYWDAQPVGSTFEVAGGTLTRVNDNQSIFTNASGKRSVMNRQDAFNTIADRIPEFAQAWKENYGYDSALSEASLRGDFDKSFKDDPIGFLSQLGIGNFTLDEANGKKYLADYKSGQMIPMEALNSIENLGRYIGDARSKVESAYGYEGTPLGDVWSQLNSGDWRFSPTDPIRAIDPLFKNVDFEPYRKIPAGTFYAIADQVYGGKNMSFEDIARIQEETGSVGYYKEDPNNPGKYMVDREKAGITKSAFDLADPYLENYREKNKIREQGGLASIVADKAVPSTGQAAVKITPANFKSEYERISADPNLTEDQMRDFITSSLQDPTIKAKLGGQLQPVLDELSRPPRERMQDQIGAQQKIIGGQYYQGAYGDPKAMIDVLEKKGVKSLADIGQKDKFEAAPAEKRYFAKDGTPLVYDGSQGVYGELDPDGGIYNIVPKDKVRTEYGYINNELRSGPDGDYYEAKFVPLSEKDVDKDGNYQKLMGKVAFNKRTGEEISDVNGQIAARSTGNVITRKNNSLNIQFTKDGVPVLTASKQRAGLGGLAQKLAPMLSMALPFVMPGIGAALSKGLAGIGGSALATGSLANAALTRGLMSGGISALGGGKFGKGFLAGAASPLISSGIGSLLPAGLSENATNAIRSAGTGVVGNVLQGGNFKDALGEGVIGGLTNYGFNEATKGLDLTPQQVNIASNIAAPLIRGKKVDPMKLFRTAMMQAYEQERQNKRPTQKKADGGLLEGPAPVKVPGNASGMDPRMFTGIAANLMARSM